MQPIRQSKSYEGDAWVDVSGCMQCCPFCLVTAFIHVTVVVGRAWNRIRAMAVSRCEIFNRDLLS